MGKKKDYTPVHWSRYFTSCEKVIVNEDGDSFQVYRRGSSGPLLVLLHGGGFSALSWALFAVIILFTQKYFIYCHIIYFLFVGSCTIALLGMH